MSLHHEFRQLEDQGIDLVEILGQDEYLRNPADLQAILDRLRERGGELYSEVLFFLTHRRFSPDRASELWQSILDNKKEMESKLGRRVCFRVAAADYLHDQTGILEGVRLLSRVEMDNLLGYVNVDDVTSVFTRRFFNDALVSEIHRARRYGHPLSLLVIDLDNFKEINDKFGHLEGDNALRQAGRLLRQSTRQNDIVCRFGGDEFAILLPESGNSEAFSLADRIRKALGRVLIKSSAVEGKKLLDEDQDSDSVPLSASIGGATYPSDCDSSEDLLRLADQRCLEAKRLGKDQIRLGAGSGFF